MRPGVILLTMFAGFMTFRQLINLVKNKKLL